MPARRKKSISFFWVLPLHGEDSQGGQNLGARVGPSKTKQKWDSQNTKEAFGGKGESVGESR